MDDPKLTMTHLAELGYCMKGVRKFCADNALDVQQLVRDGLPLSLLDPIDDAMVHKATTYVREKVGA